MDEASLQAEGWTAFGAEGFCHHISPMWMRGQPGTREIGLLIQPSHANAYGQTIYGGALMAFADAALSVGVGEALGGGFSVTAQLQTHFVSGARVGEVVAHSDGIWKALEASRPQQ
jgi:acyl-coenzyme A thioesterase PaaI-like protein